MNFDGLKGVLKGKNLPILNELFKFLDKLCSVISDPKNAVFFSAFQLPSDEDISFIEQSYDNLIPFVIDSTSNQYDIYCYDYGDQACPKVAVFSDHAIVKKWDSTLDFLNWLEIVAIKQ